LWKFIEHTDTTSTYIIINPLIKDDFALQYENGNLALRPYNIINNFENQKWIVKDTIVSRGIPVLNYSPTSLFTAEFDPYASTTDSYSNNITEQNTQQMNEVINGIKIGFQQYLGQLDNKNQTDGVSTSFLGRKENPLNINLNLNSKEKQISGFADISNNNDLPNDMISIMDRYGTDNSTGSKFTELFRKTDLANELSNKQGCKLLNINDYTSNRVGSCNCKL